MGSYSSRALNGHPPRRHRNLAVQGLGMDPPEILYRNTPAVLVTIDGDLILEQVSDDGLIAAVNTAFAILPGWRRGRG